MLTGFEKIVEERIQQSIRNGEFNNLPGEGQPLKADDFSRIPEDLRLAYRILKNADCVPPEIDIKKEIIRTETLLERQIDEKQRYQTIRKLNFLIMKLNTMRKGRVSFEIPQKYENQIVDRIGPGKSSKAAGR
jgi:hypothetical protein